MFVCFENDEDFYKDGNRRSRSCKNPNIHNKSTYPILEFNFSASSREKDNLAEILQIFEREILETLDRKNKKKKVREEQNVSSRRERTIPFLSRLFFVCHATLFWGVDGYY